MQKKNTFLWLLLNHPQPHPTPALETLSTPWEGKEGNRNGFLCLPVWGCKKRNQSNDGHTFHSEWIKLCRIDLHEQGLFLRSQCVSGGEGRRKQGPFPAWDNKGAGLHLCPIKLNIWIPVRSKMEPVGSGQRDRYESFYWDQLLHVYCTSGWEERKRSCAVFEIYMKMIP